MRVTFDRGVYSCTYLCACELKRWWITANFPLNKGIKIFFGYTAKKHKAEPPSIMYNVSSVFTLVSLLRLELTMNAFSSKR